MNEEHSMIIDESIELELNVAELYMIFHAAFPEDADFWWKLLLEEKNHAALIRSIKEIFLPAGKFPDEIFSTSLEKLKKSNTELRGLIKKCRHITPSREDAFNVALEIEQSAIEIHFQKFIDKKGKSKIEEIFEHLNRDDKDHAKRIHSYMDAHGIERQKRDLQKPS
jgi:hypothetical protein